jgi:hypothetical protein
MTNTTRVSNGLQRRQCEMAIWQVPTQSNLPSNDSALLRGIRK